MKHTALVAASKSAFDVFTRADTKITNFFFVVY